MCMPDICMSGLGLCSLAPYRRVFGGRTDITRIFARITMNYNFSGQETFGMLYYAEVTSFEEELHSEIEHIILTEELMKNWTYPEIQPKLLWEARRRGFL